MRVEVFNVIDTEEFEKLVHEYLGKKDFEYTVEFENMEPHICYNIECKPSYSRFKPDTPKDQIDKWFMDDIERVNKWVIGKYSAVGQAQILQWLAYKELIPEGNYLIEI